MRAELEAKERGEVARREDGRPKRSYGAWASPATLADLGISSQRAAKFRVLNKTGPAVVERAISASAPECRT